jgi:hypothetical protein
MLLPAIWVINVTTSQACSYHDIVLLMRYVLPITRVTRNNQVTEKISIHAGCDGVTEIIEYDRHSKNC